MVIFFILFIAAILIGIISPNVKNTNNETIVNSKVYYHPTVTTVNGKVVNDAETCKKFEAVFNKHFTK
jgi:hypothetical protein